MNKKELLDKKITELLKLDLKKDNSKEVFEDIKQQYMELVDNRLNNEKKK